jgi:hypothetical protein
MMWTSINPNTHQSILLTLQTKVSDQPHAEDIQCVHLIRLNPILCPNLSPVPSKLNKTFFNIFILYDAQNMKFVTKSTNLLL